MQYYASDNNRNGKRAGVIALACYAVLFTTVCLLISFDISTEETSEGILIDFGTETEGFGDQNVALAENEEPAASATTDGQQEYLTQDNEEAPAITSSAAKNKKPQTEPTTNSTNNTKSNSSSVEQTHKVNRKALFPGASTTSEVASQGNTEQAKGNAGNLSGGDGVTTGTGTGTDGISFDLAGRSPIGELPRPINPTNNAGRVVIEITVDANGNVNSASFSPRGSNTQDASLREVATKAARQAKFTPSEKDAIQRGTITYIFKLE